MMKLYIKIYLVIISVTLLTCSNDNLLIHENATLPYKEFLNVTYGADSDQMYDLYLPEGRDSNTKVMILIHGGSWISGDKSEMNVIKNMYQIDFPGLAIVSMNYRLADQNNPPFPMQIDDITMVVEHLKSKKYEYVISNDIGILGTSAGGHLALLWSYAYDTQNKVKMVCSIVGPTNLTDPAYLESTNPELQSLLNIYGINPTIEFLEEVSPLFRVHENASPTILFYGGMDPLIPVTQGTDLKIKLDALGVINEFTLYPNAGHGWGGAELIDTWSKLKAFTETYLLP